MNDSIDMANAAYATFQLVSVPVSKTLIANNSVVLLDWVGQANIKGLKWVCS